jgi:hypothetical protein
MDTTQPDECECQVCGVEVGPDERGAWRHNNGQFYDADHEPLVRPSWPTTLEALESAQRVLNAAAKRLEELGQAKEDWEELCNEAWVQATNQDPA